MKLDFSIYDREENIDGIVDNIMGRTSNYSLTYDITEAPRLVDKIMDQENSILNAAKEPITIGDIAGVVDSPLNTVRRYVERLVDTGRMECTEDAVGRKPAVYQSYDIPIQPPGTTIS